MREWGLFPEETETAGTGLVPFERKGGHRAGSRGWFPGCNEYKTQPMDVGID
jgi:hypothetical protein